MNETKKGKQYKNKYKCREFRFIVRYVWNEVYIKSDLNEI